MFLHRDTPIFIPGSSVNIRQADIFAAQGQGRWNRPTEFTKASKIAVERDGSFKLFWEDGNVSYVSADAVASFAIHE